MARKQGSGFLAPLSCSLSPVPLGAERGGQCSGIATSGGLMVSDCALGLNATSVGCTKRQRAPLGGFLPYLDPHDFFSLALQKSNSINHQKKPYTFTRKNHYLHIFCMCTASYLHYKCHKHVLVSDSFIFSRWQKNSSLRLCLKTYFYLNNDVLLNNGTHKQIIMLETHFALF